MTIKEFADDNAVEFDNRRWEAELRGIACLKQCRFPASNEIELGGTREQATTDGKPLEAQLENQATEAYHGYPMPPGDPLGPEIVRRWKSYE